MACVDHEESHDSCLSRLLPPQRGERNDETKHASLRRGSSERDVGARPGLSAVDALAEPLLDRLGRGDCLADCLGDCTRSGAGSCIAAELCPARGCTAQHSGQRHRAVPSTHHLVTPAPAEQVALGDVLFTNTVGNTTSSPFGRAGFSASFAGLHEMRRSFARIDHSIDSIMRRRGVLHSAVPVVTVAARDGAQAPASSS